MPQKYSDIFFILGYYAQKNDSLNFYIFFDLADFESQVFKVKSNLIYSPEFQSKYIIPVFKNSTNQYSSQKPSRSEKIVQGFFRKPINTRKASIKLKNNIKIEL